MNRKHDMIRDEIISQYDTPFQLELIVVLIPVLAFAAFLWSIA
jgi:hypothetical protein